MRSGRNCGGRSRSTTAEANRRRAARTVFRRVRHASRDQFLHLQLGRRHRHPQAGERHDRHRPRRPREADGRRPVADLRQPARGDLHPRIGRGDRGTRAPARHRDRTGHPRLPARPPAPVHRLRRNPRLACPARGHRQGRRRAERRGSHRPLRVAGRRMPAGRRGDRNREPRPPEGEAAGRNRRGAAGNRRHLPGHRQLDGRPGRPGGGGRNAGPLHREPAPEGFRGGPPGDPDGLPGRRPCPRHRHAGHPLGPGRS